MNRDDYPLFSGLLAYFPDALSEVARCSRVGNDQHNPGEPLHWARHKSTAHADKILRHLRDSLSSPMDSDGILHVVKVAWRALAMAQEAVESMRPQQIPPPNGGSSLEAMIERAESDDPQVGSLKAGEAA